MGGLRARVRASAGRMGSDGAPRRARSLTTSRFAAALGSGADTVARLQPPRVARLLARQTRVVIAARTHQRVVALTFDDGPHETLTPQILEVLARHRARATFFFLGSGVVRHPRIARAAVAAGHELGNHGWLDRPTLRMSPQHFRHDSRRTAEAIRTATGEDPRYVRPGSGWFRPSHLREVRAGGSGLVLGSIAVVDPMVKDVERELRFVLERLTPGAVIVLHEGLAEREGVVAFLDRLLPELAGRGYSTLTLSELLDGGAT